MTSPGPSPAGLVEDPARAPSDEARCILAADCLECNDPFAAALALDPLLLNRTAPPPLLRRIFYDAAATLCVAPRPAQMLPEGLKRLRALPSSSAADIRTVQREIGLIFDPFAGDTAFAFTGGQLFFICMTPRSGSTFLARCLRDIGAFGRPGEYLHRNEPTAMPKIAGQFRTPDLDSYLARVLYHTATANGACGIKTDFGSFLPLLIEGTFDRLCASAKIIYLTREDVTMQAVSLARAQITGAWSTAVPAERPAEFDLKHIHGAALHISQMMAQWETLFAFHGIQPLRLSYEAIDADIDGVIGRIADHIGVPRGAWPSFRTSKESVQRDALNTQWRSRFVAEFAGRAAL